MILYLTIIGICIGSGILAQTGALFPAFQKRVNSSVSGPTFNKIYSLLLYLVLDISDLYLAMSVACQAEHSASPSASTLSSPWFSLPFPFALSRLIPSSHPLNSNSANMWKIERVLQVSSTLAFLFCSRGGITS